MLTFFRRIRLRLMNQAMSDTVRKGLLDMSATRKYLLYAIGEIALVVIGILIALSINNWNEYRKERIKEVKILMEIRSNLLSNQKNIELTIENAEKHKNRITELLDFWDYKTELASKRLYFNLEFVRRLGRFEYNDAAYESLKTIGFDIIENDSIRLEISNLFENVYETSKSLINANDGYSNLAINKVYELCCPSKNGVIVPDDLETFRNDRVFYNKLTLRYDWKAYVSHNMKSNLKKTQRVLQLIKDELEK